MKRSAILLVFIIVTLLFGEKTPMGYKVHERVPGSVTLFFTERATPRGEKSVVESESPVIMYKVSEQYLKGLKDLNSSAAVVGATNGMIVGAITGLTVGIQVALYSTKDAEKIERRELCVARVDYKGDVIKPRMTDSIQIDGVTGYPSPNNAFWQFPLTKGRVNLLSARHSYLFLPLYYNSENALESFPDTLVPTDEENQGRKSSDIADSLARFPRLFCAYDYAHFTELPFIGAISVDTGKYVDNKDLQKLLAAFNVLPESALLPAGDAAEISLLTREICSMKMETLSDNDLLGLLKRDTTNVIVHLRFAEKQFHEGKLDSMAYYLEKAEQFSYENDYLVLTGKGLHAEHRQNYGAAEEYYTKALQNVPQAVLSSCRKELLQRLETVRSAQKIANGEFVEEELELEL